jgi:hypothetical protein
MKGTGTSGFKLDCGGYKVRSSFISARNARRIERKKHKDIGHGRNQEQLGREGQKEEGSGNCAIL